ncbi:unnamed protein product [Allacma fusca]|uniref:Uncharacterized protein n=1 Tax=Allacma fusca TaxID=39272 RepID=A0A8J2KUV6_9HEXA|nr:unnamed protein product [Allacma fusca]
MLEFRFSVTATATPDVEAVVPPFHAVVLAAADRVFRVAATIGVVASFRIVDTALATLHAAADQEPQCPATPEPIPHGQKVAAVQDC